MGEHVLQDDSHLLLSSSTLEGNVSYVPHLAESSLYQQHIIKAEDYNCYSVPQLIGYHRMAPYYVEYLAGNGISDVQGEIPFDSSGIGCSLIPEEYFLSTNAHQIGPQKRLSVQNSRPQHEVLVNNSSMNTHHAICYQKQVADEGLDNATLHQPNMSASTSGIQTKSRKRYSRQKASDADRRRRTRIAAALDALEDLFPQRKEGNKTNIIDDCIEYIKYLQLHLKELSQNRLGGEPTSNHLIYLEGYGHHLVHENTSTGPLQDMLGKLLESNPSAATKLLESRGLFMMPGAPK